MPHLRVMLNEKGSTPQFYHHCEDTPCAVVCPIDVITRVDGAMQLGESLCVSCRLYSIACSFGMTGLSSSRPLGIPVNTNTPKASSTPPTPARISTLLNWVSGTRTIAVKCDLCSSNEQGPACIRMCPAKALHLVDNTDIIHVNRCKRELTFSTDLGDLTLFQQTQSEEAK